MFDLSPSSPWPRRWLMLAVLSLALSGIFSIILVVSRTPQLIALFPWMGELFSVSLVIHVDLSVLVWFLSITGLLWSLLGAHRGVRGLPFADAASWGCVLAGTLAMAASPLTGEWEVIKSNYVPVITNALFFAGLGLLASGMGIATIQAFQAAPEKEAKPEDWGVYLSLPVMVVALLCFISSAAGLPDDFRGFAFYENLFWAGGHVLQFIYVQIMLVAWVVLARALGLALPSRNLLMALFWLGPVISLSSFIPYLIYDVYAQEHIDFFTLKMNVGLGIAGIVLGAWLLIYLLRRCCHAKFAMTPAARTLACEEISPALGSTHKGAQQRDSALSSSHSASSRRAEETNIKTAYRSALVTSLILFFVGGTFGAVIDGPNVKIPAHYHGSIVAVSLALMGLAYYLLPKLGGREVAHWRMARWQPWCYAVGQLLHISGLAISGGYGVLRKTVGDVGSGGWEVKAALGMMGGGGLLAILGGLLFVVIMVKGFRRCAVSANVG